jgi:hypothetical protein
VTTDDPGEFDDKVRKLLDSGDMQTVVEGLRLVIAFRKIKDDADRLKVIELAERLAE